MKRFLPPDEGWRARKNYQEHAVFPFRAGTVLSKFSEQIWHKKFGIGMLQKADAIQRIFSD